MSFIRKGMRQRRFSNRILFFSIIASATIFCVCALLSCKEKRKVSADIEAVWTGENGKLGSNGLVLIAEYCEKIQSCAQDDLNRLNKDEKSILEKRLRPDVCLQKFKETPVYKLEVENPETAVARTGSCLQKVIDSDCESIKKGVSSLSEDCMWLYSNQISK
ncbi:hypothetical protein EHO60_06055 [Leptospira fletcheri]|uniref:Uncharacterized protein n=1 Tax=Leptospira fletcheri TaxID=2484981 RepID=A0A4R9GH10_9LEPT|nr:hypothetical protein [Leptospira fletcheri]TGK11849.1 hypothetical protein EHO60_06055 [Leptospira fletcheri]